MSELLSLPPQFSPMNNNLRMSGAIALMLKKSKDRRQHEALEAAFKVRKREEKGTSSMKLDLDKYFD